MPKDTTRAVTVRQWRAQPMPDFKEIHRRREQFMAKCKLQSVASRLKTPSRDTCDSGSEHSTQLTCHQISCHPKDGTQQVSDDFDFACDENSLKSILSNVGIAPPAAVSQQSGPAPTETVTNHYLKHGLVQNTNSTPLRVRLVNDRSSIYYNIVTTGGRTGRVESSAALAMSSAKRARRVPAKSDYSPAMNQNQNTLSRFSGRAATTGGTAATTPRVDGDGLQSVRKKSGGLSCRRSRSATRPLNLAESTTGKTSTPRCETRSASRSRKEAKLARAIYFDDPDRIGQQFVKDKAGMGLRNHQMVEICRQSPSKVIYHDPTDSQPSPLSPWRHHNILPGTGDGSNGRSPLSIIDRSSIGKSRSTIGLRSKDKNPLAVAKEAVAELMANEKWIAKENASIGKGQHVSNDVTAIKDVQQLNCANQKSESSSTLNIQKAELEIRDSDLVPRIDAEEEEEEENKENSDRPGELPERYSHKSKKEIEDTKQQLELKARNLRRRSQLTTDVGEIERLTEQLKLIRKRQRELDELCSEITAKLDNICSVKSGPTAAAVTKPSFAKIPEDTDQPLNLKISWTADEPINLKVNSSMASSQTANKDATSRVILADITEKVVGSITEEEAGYFEVPDSPTVDKVAFGSCAEISNLGASSPLDLCTVKKSCSEPALSTAKDSPTKTLQCYIESLNLSVISEATASPTVAGNDVKFCSVDLPTSSPVSARHSPVVSESPAGADSPNISSEFVGYRSYRPLLEEIDGRCGDPVALELALIEDDGHPENKQHFVPISLDQSDMFDHE